MTRSPSVVGIMMLKDEWPLCAVSISHALEACVDVLWVVDHDSGGITATGLDELLSLWGERLKVLRLNGTPYWQEAVTASAVEACGAEPDDWIFMIDADEFPLTREGLSVKEQLRGIGGDVDVVRYEVENWISTQDFDANVLDDYRGLRHRACPNVFVPDGEAVIAEEIELGHINFFDVPFGSKILVRRRAAKWIGSGAHRLKDGGEPAEVSLAREDLRSAHLPFLCADRLSLKIEQGRTLIERGFPENHGWQSQMLYRMAGTGKRESFWVRHTTGPSDAMNGSPPLSTVDDALAIALDPTIGTLHGFFGPRLDAAARTTAPAPPVESTIAFSDAVRLVRRLQIAAEQLAHENERALSALSASRHQLEASESSIDSLAEEGDRLSRQVAHLEMLIDDLRHSTSWRMTSPMRAMSRWLNGARSRSRPS